MKVLKLIKSCSKCFEVKPLENFYKDKSKPSGYRYECKTCNDKTNVLYRKTNSDKIKQTKKAYAEKNKDKRRKLMLEWQRANKDKVKQAGKLWHTKNPGASTERSRRRRTRLNGNLVFQVEKAFVTKLKSMPCFYCGSHELIEADHVIPISRGGNHSKGNLVPACRTCNRSKGDRTITEWNKLRRSA